MRLMAPADYEDFACLASACRHTCCAGWEIDIDPETAALYGQVPGPFGARLRACIRQEEEGFSFALDAEDRCPMLRKDGLCEIILRLGLEALCQICADHPRFRNDFSDRVEILITKGLSKPERVREIIRNSIRKLTKAEIMAQCPDIGGRTVERALASLQESGEIIKIGGGRYTSYIWNRGD